MGFEWFWWFNPNGHKSRWDFWCSISVADDITNGGVPPIFYNEPECITGIWGWHCAELFLRKQLLKGLCFPCFENCFSWTFEDLEDSGKAHVRFGTVLFDSKSHFDPEIRKYGSILEDFVATLQWTCNHHFKRPWTSFFKNIIGVRPVWRRHRLRGLEASSKLVEDWTLPTTVISLPKRSL